MRSAGPLPTRGPVHSSRKTNEHAAEQTEPPEENTAGALVFRTRYARSCRARTHLSPQIIVSVQPQSFTSEGLGSDGHDEGGIRVDDVIGAFVC